MELTPIYTFETNTYVPNISLIINEDLGAGEGLSPNLRVVGYEEFIKRGYSPMIIRLKPTKNTIGNKPEKTASDKYRYCWARLTPRRVYGDVSKADSRDLNSNYNIEMYKDNFRINSQGILEIVTEDGYTPVEARHLCAFRYYYNAEDNSVYLRVLNGTKPKNIWLYDINTRDDNVIITRRFKYGLVFVDWSNIRNPCIHKFEKNEYKSNIQYFDVVITLIVATDGGIQVNCNFSESR